MVQSERGSPRTSKTARFIATLPAIACVIVQPIADFNSTHMFNHRWPPHAKFHGAWLMVATVSMGFASLYLLWGRYEAQGTRFALVMATLLPILAWGAFLPALAVPGISTWPDGTTQMLPVNPNIVMASAVVAISVVAMFVDARWRSTL